ncbi:MAG: c-type cytochrome [Lentimicrobium sp.]|nr:c-type cytochrome [Lentimicrobium sp.]
MTQKQINRLIPAALCLLLIGSSCDRSRNDKGYEYFPDMAHSLAAETYAPNSNFEDGSTMRLPAENTIPREIIPYPYDNSLESRALAAAIFSNPLEKTAENIIAGKEKYNIFCKNCHGETGDGNGHLFTSKRYAIKPASLLSEKMLSAPEADIFHVITAGYQVMGAHGQMIRPDDRWRIAMFVKQELQANTLK